MNNRPRHTFCPIGLKQLIVIFVHDLARTPSRVFRGSPPHQRAYGATGGTVNAVARLLRKLGAKVVASDFMVELGFLNPRPNLVGCGTVNSLLIYQ